MKITYPYMTKLESLVFFRILFSEKKNNPSVSYILIATMKNLLLFGIS